jgi:hypothetical protein
MSFRPGQLSEALARKTGVLELAAFAHLVEREVPRDGMPERHETTR